MSKYELIELKFDFYACFDDLRCKINDEVFIEFFVIILSELNDKKMVVLTFMLCKGKILFFSLECRN